MQLRIKKDSLQRKAERYEMIYMNRKTLEAYGLKSLDEIKGRKCYEILQKSSIPCGMCNNDKICEGFFEEWRHYNSVIDKYHQGICRGNQ